MGEVIDRLNTALSGRYVIEREIGAGGMATVYLARDLRHQRKVAVKVLRPELAAVEEFWRGIAAEPALARLCASTLFVGQPIARGHTLEVPAPALGVPVIIDEADVDLDAFPAAKALGYRGVSSKSCKGLYTSLANLARVERWNRETHADRYFLSAEDLTMQAGIAVQQDLALLEQT